MQFYQTMNIEEKDSSNTERTVYDNIHTTTTGRMQALRLK